MSLSPIITESSRKVLTRHHEQDWKGCVSVVVPVYNEADHIDKLLRAINASPVPKEIIVVDDGSTDGTKEKLLALVPTDNVALIFHEKNQGKGAAIRTALRFARGEYLLIQDSDLEYDPQDYAALLRPLQENKSNVVYGVRPARPERGLRFFLGAKFLTVLTNLLFGTDIRDEATCYKAFRRSLLRGISLQCRRFEFCPEVTAKLCRMGERIWEVPISYTPRTKKQGEKSTVLRRRYCHLDACAISVRFAKTSRLFAGD